jgi:FixJ family two-component response regulator
MKNSSSIVAVVDDDESVRESLPDLLREFGFASRTFASAKAFLDSGTVGETGCLILDISMPDMSGPELHEELNRRNESVPVVFITGNPEAREQASLLQNGAMECLLKTFSDEELRSALDLALRSS